MAGMETTVLESLEAAAGPREEAAPCPVCGGGEFEVARTPRHIEAEVRWLRRFYRARVTGGGEAMEDRAEFTQAEPAHVVRCLGCGTLLRDPRPTPETLRAKYAQDTYGEVALERLAEGQRDFFEGRMPWLRRVLPPPADILEVGAFVGGFLAATGAAGYHAVGVDVGEETVAFMRARGLDARRGDVREMGLPRQAWDGVFIWNTFDQLEEPRAVLERVAALLRPDGILVLRVPNGEFETACLKRRARFRHARRAASTRRAQAYNNFLTFPYLAGYTPGSLRRLLEESGFEVTETRGDTLLRLADEDTRPCAVAEEARVQRAVRRACRRVERASGRMLWPWMDVVARLRSA